MKRLWRDTRFFGDVAKRVATTGKREIGQKIPRSSNDKTNLAEEKGVEKRGMWNAKASGPMFTKCSSAGKSA